MDKGTDLRYLPYACPRRLSGSATVMFMYNLSFTVTCAPHKLQRDSRACELAFDYGAFREDFTDPEQLFA